AAARRSLAKLDFELRSLREEETYSHSLLNGAYVGTASVISRRVAGERDRFGWLQLPLEAADVPPMEKHEMQQWLYICRHRDATAAEKAQLRIARTDVLPTPHDFALYVSAEREAEGALQRLAALRAHMAYQPIVTLPAEARRQLGDGLRQMSDRRREL